MNKKQLVVMWCGIIAIVLMGLFPPCIYPRQSSYGVHQRYYQFILSTWGNIDIIRLCVQWAMVAVITGGLIYTLKGRNKPYQVGEKTESTE